MRALWPEIDPFRWTRVNHNPVALLADLEPARLADLGADPAFLERVEAAWQRFQHALHGAGALADAPAVAYFSMEYGLHASVRTYSGGLGVLAGDHLKSASDLGVPLVAIGLLYHEGYFTQVIDDGRQVPAYPPARLPRLPIRPVHGPAGPLTVEVHLGETEALARVWRVDVGRVPLYLLDTDLAPNPPEIRALCARLYGGDEKTRILQEILLGIGGVRVLDALGARPSVYHLNEGHCAFAPLELLRQRTAAGIGWHEAIESVRAQCVFTTHTPVPAGHDRFPFALVHDTLGAWRREAGWMRGAVMDLGRTRPGDWDEPLNMTVLALRLTRSANGVARRHGEVSRRMWHGLWPDLAVDDVPIGHITNGVHPTMWCADLATALWDAQLPGWRDHLWDPAWFEDRIDAVPDEAIWATRNALRRRLVAEVARRTGVHLDPDALTIGFARRFATYKRGDLLFSDPERLMALLEGPYPVQLVFSGKAHPRDFPGQEVLGRILAHAAEPRFRDRVVFVPDYDMTVGGLLTSGVDVWLNNPRRPQEASGTSGQKVVLNTGLNLSVPDGWWVEGYDGTNGWSIGPDVSPDHPAASDASDAEALYAALEQEVLPSWKDRDARGLPTSWIARIKRSTATCMPRFTSHRMVRDYVQQIYTAD